MVDEVVPVEVVLVELVVVLVGPCHDTILPEPKKGVSNDKL